MDKELCSACRLEPPTWSNKLLLGCDAKLCFACFRLWFDGMTNPMEIRRERIARDAQETGFRL